MARFDRFFCCKCKDHSHKMGPHPCPLCGGPVAQVEYVHSRIEDGALISEFRYAGFWVDSRERGEAFFKPEFWDLIRVTSSRGVADGGMT